VSSTASLSVLIVDKITTAWFRLFVGDLSNDVSDDVLSSAFNKYPSFQKARVIRDRLSQKVRFLLRYTALHPRLTSLFCPGKVRLCRILRSGRLLEGLEGDGWYVSHY
jgi:hypothetical protein